MGVGHHIGKNPTVADQFLIAGLRQDRDRKCHLRKYIQQGFVLNQRNALIKQILPLKDSRRIDTSVHPNHEIEGEFVFGTEFRDGPENEVCPQSG